MTLNFNVLVENLFRLLESLTLKYHIILNVSSKLAQRSFYARALFLALYWSLIPVVPPFQERLLSSFLVNNFGKKYAPCVPVSHNKIKYDPVEKVFVWKSYKEDSLTKMVRINFFTKMQHQFLSVKDKWV